MFFYTKNYLNGSKNSNTLPFISGSILIYQKQLEI